MTISVSFKSLSCLNGNKSIEISFHRAALGGSSGSTMTFSEMTQIQNLRYLI